jgi:hypothetical protein
VPDIDRRTVFFERPLDDLDGALDTGAKTARLGQDYSNHRSRFSSSFRPEIAPRDGRLTRLSLPQLAPPAQSLGI